MATKTARNLIAGSGTVTTTAGSRVLTFSSAQTFKPGATIYISDGSGTEKLTIDQGSGTSWTTVQPAAAGAAGRSFSMSDNGTGRSRGSSGWLIPNAVHFSYQSMVDDAGNPDCYIYVDTLAPENGVHPYNFDKLMGSFKTGKDVAQIIPDINMRVRRLEGVLRAGRASGSLSQDFRLNALEERVRLLEVWANSTGHFGTPPGVTSTTAWTEQQFLDNGDPA
ncbi:MAG: hypothetical protein DMD87_17205 [Candidatus Rokuibacteriota bacterium]|nr:MAG: hypothetical protein DMD87_17205 [Candidatus Rokubacteria bacterium]